jgi:hypothetical protein
VKAYDGTLGNARYFPFLFLYFYHSHTRNGRASGKRQRYAEDPFSEDSHFAENEEEEKEEKREKTEGKKEEGKKAEKRKEVGDCGEKEGKEKNKSFYDRWSCSDAFERCCRFV